LVLGDIEEPVSCVTVWHTGGGGYHRQHEPERVDEEVALARGGPHIAAEQVIYQVPNPVCAPGPQIVIDNPPGRQIMGQQSAS
jgi:hypothetical protein